jgi:uncharacterized protein (DUF1697 family)
MTYSFAFLRAINVGKRRVSMADLAGALSQAGLENVETFIASGNFVFKGDQTEAAIETALLARFGFLAEAFVRSRNEIADLVRFVHEMPSTKTAHSVQIGFLKTAPDGALMAKLTHQSNELDQFAYGSKEVVWFPQTRSVETPFGKKGMNSKAWPVNSFRNINTLERMLAKWH